MPNWVQNEIIFDNADNPKISALIRELKLAIESNASVFDFNRLIPMPQSLNIESGSMTDRAIAYYVTERLTIPVEQTNLSSLITNSFNENWANEIVSRLKKSAETGLSEDWDKLYEQGKRYLFNREHYGCYTWYDWCSRNWGTKWNARDPEWSLDDSMLIFQTAWSAPFPVIEAIAAKFPDLEFTHRWADEDIGNNCGQMWYSEGCGSYLDVDDERALAMDLWGYSDDDFDEYDEEDDDDCGAFFEELIDELQDDDDTTTEAPTVVDSGLSISDLI